MELGARIDQVSEKMSATMAMMTKMIMIIMEYKIYFFSNKTFKIQFSSLSTTRYDFEANKKNNLIFYGLPSDPRETPHSLVTKVKLKSEGSTSASKESVSSPGDEY